MKTSKFFLSTLIAASAMTATAYADITVANTTQDITADLSGTLTLAGVNGGGPGTANILVSGTLDAIIHKNTDGYYGAAGTVNIGNSETQVNVATGRIEMGDLLNSNGSTLNINSGSALIITGNNNSGNSYKVASLLLGEWGAKTTVNVYGTMLAKEATAFSGDSGMVMNVSGGTLAVNGIGVGNPDKSPTSSLNLSNNGKLILGGAGINHAQGAWSSSLGAGTVGLSTDSTTINTVLTVTDATTGTTFDTTQYIFSDTGVNQTLSQGSTGGTISLLGGINGAGTVKVVGNGTLVLGGKVELSSAIQNSGTVTVSDTAVFSLANLTAGEGGVYTLFTNSEGASVSWSGEMGLGNVDLTGTDIAVRGASATFSGAGVTVISGVAADLVWAGTEGNATWNSSATNWLNNESADKFYTGDNVTFGADAGNKDVNFESGASLSVGTMSISENQAYHFIGNAASLHGETLTVENGALLSLDASGIYNFDFENITINDGGMISLTNSTSQLFYDTLTLKDGATLKFTNGAGAGTIGGENSKIIVDAEDGVATIAGSVYGNSSNVKGIIEGVGTIQFGVGNSDSNNWSNHYSVSAVLKDGAEGSLSVIVEVDPSRKEGGQQVLTLSGNNTYSGGTTITSGTLKLGSRGALGHGGATVKSNGTLDFNGNNFGDGTGGYGDAITLSGGSIVNNGGSVGTDQRQLASVTLTADSYVGGSGNFGIISYGWGNSTLTLNGHTLTKNGDNDFWLTGTDVSSGVIDVQSGRLVLINGKDSNNFSMADGAKIKLGVSGKLHALGVQNEAAGTGTKISLGSVEIVMTDESKSVARLTNQDSTFVVADSAKLYLDVTGLTLNGTEDVSLTIAGANAISSESFFDQVLVGSYDEQGAWVSSEWYYLADSWNSETGTLTLTIPEPSAFGLLAGVGALALVASRRRRSRR